MKKLILICLILLNIGVKAQTCSDIIYTVETKLTADRTLYSSSLNSEWLLRVSGYEYEGEYIVIASIKQNDWDYSGKKYVFCGIKPSNWKAFSSVYTDYELTYGEKFHKYIMSNLCNCK